MSTSESGFLLDGEHSCGCFQPFCLEGQNRDCAAPVHYIYMDEAGTSAKEPVTVVVGVIIHADRHWRSAAQLLETTLDSLVPADLRRGFHFHAKVIWGGYRDRDKSWPREERAKLIASVASIPRQLRAAISLAMIRREYGGDPNARKLRPHEFHHVLAFHKCMARANKYVRDWAPATEVATVVAEDVPEMRRFLKNSLRVPLLETPLRPGFIVLTDQEKEAGVILQTNTGPIDRIIDTVHFVEKDDAPLLQIADACAFSFRRFFSDQDYGADLVAGMMGAQLKRREWDNVASNFTFDFDLSHTSKYPRAPL